MAPTTRSSCDVCAGRTTTTRPRDDWPNLRPGLAPWVKTLCTSCAERASVPERYGSAA
jgi:hypothetical protein